MCRVRLYFKPLFFCFTFKNISITGGPSMDAFRANPFAGGSQLGPLGINTAPRFGNNEQGEETGEK
jgi:hypothetical protein